MDYRERLGVPLRWWVQGTMLVASLWLAVVVALPGPAAWLVTAVALAVMVLAFTGYGAARLEVADGVFRAGRARIAGHHLDRPAALDVEATRRAAGVEADARAYLLLRPYLKRSVRIEVVDPADPTPYWLVSTRHPEALAQALLALAAEGRHGPRNGSPSPG